MKTRLYLKLVNSFHSQFMALEAQSRNLTGVQNGKVAQRDELIEDYKKYDRGAGGCKNKFSTTWVG